MKSDRPRLGKIGITAVALLALVVMSIVYFLYPPSSNPVEWPDGKAFAFTIVDDTDMSTLENVRPIYDYLWELNLLTTKTVWILPTNNPEVPVNLGHTLRDSAYAVFVTDLQQKGYEIALHGARGGDSKRPETVTALEEYKETFGDYPNIHINHYLNKDDVYWGADKLSIGLFRELYRLAGNTTEFSGDDSESEYFWGDLLSKHISYVVNFSFFEINLLNVNPAMPYHNPDKPYVNYWFHTSDGGLPESFNNLLKKENLDRLEAEGGACIVYTHFGKEFYKDGSINEQTRRRLKDVAFRNGWFVPAGQILDYLRKQHPDREQLSFREQVRLELYWMWEKLVHGAS
jgi:hypothetical protein